MAISKEIWEEMEILAAKLGVAKLALKYQRYGFNYYYHSKRDVLTRIEFLRKAIHSLYEREKSIIINKKIPAMANKLEVHQNAVISSVNTFADSMDIDFMDAIDLYEKGFQNKIVKSKYVDSPFVDDTEKVITKPTKS